MSTNRTPSRREFLDGPSGALPARRRSPPSSRPRRSAAAAPCPQRPHRDGRHRLRHAGARQHEQLPRQERGAVGRRVRPGRRGAGQGAEHRQHEVRQQGLRHLQGLPGAVRPRRPRCGVDRRARPLARHPVDLARARGPGRLRREALHAQPPGGARALRRSPAVRPRVADRELAAFGGQLPPGVRARRQRPDREDPARRGGAASGYTDFARTFGQETIESPPAGFDYDRGWGRRRSRRTARRACT